MSPDLATSADTTSSWDAIVKQASGMAGSDDALAKSLEETGKVRKAITSNILTQTPPPPPEMPKLPEPPPPATPTDTLKSFGSVASLLGIFGGMLTRRPLQTSLNAAAGAMKAARENDLETYQQNYDAWKAQTDYATKIQEWQMNRYNAAVNQYKNNQDALMGALTALSAQDQNAALMHQIQTGDMSLVMQALKNQEDAISKFKEINLQVDDLALRQKEQLDNPVTAAMEQFRSEHPNASADEIARFNAKLKVGTSPAAVALQEYMAEHPDASSADIASFIQTTRPPRSPQAMAMQKYIEENPQATSTDIASFGADYNARNKAVQAFATGKQGDIVRSFNTSTQHLGTLEQLSDALANSDNTTFNRIANAWATEWGQTAPNNFNSAKQIVGNELVKAIVGAGGGVGDRDKAQAVLDDAKSPEQLREAIGTIRDLIKGQLTGLKKQYEDTTGKTDFDSRLTGAAKTMLEGGKAPEQTDIDYLRGHDSPDMRARFDKEFGDGSAAKVLGQ